MKCKKCRKSIPDGSKFCNFCGSRVKESSIASPRKDGRIEKKITINGERISFYGKTEAELIQNIAEYQGAREKKTQVETFSHYSEQLERTWDKLSPNSLRGYKPALQRCVDQFGEMHVDEITPAMIKSFLDSLGKTKKRKTVTTHRSMIAQTLELAILDNALQSNPANAKFKTAGKPDKKRQAADDADVESIKQYWSEDNFSLLGYLILYSGLRKGEALALTYGDVDRESKRIRVKKSVYYMGNSPHIKSPKTAAGEREVILLDCLSEKLKQGKKDEYIFSTDGKTLYPSHVVMRGWGEFCLRHGMAETKEDTNGHKYIGCNVSLHQLRHSFATMCYEMGLDKMMVQEMMGHTDYGVTEKYTHIRDKKLNDTAKQMNEYVVKMSSSAGKPSK